MTKSAILAGIGVILFGIWIGYEVTFAEEFSWWLYSYPIIIIASGIAMMIFWKSEDIIEERQDKEL